uniref:Putative secreted protein n=1 Tax=Ixodes ricinus TaxID=34613 RepID=A0A6B0TXE7_IXORI
MMGLVCQTSFASFCWCLPHQVLHSAMGSGVAHSNSKSLRAWYYSRWLGRRVVRNVRQSYPEAAAGSKTPEKTAAPPKSPAHD